MILATCNCVPEFFQADPWAVIAYTAVWLLGIAAIIFAASKF